MYAQCEQALTMHMENTYGQNVWRNGYRKCYLQPAGGVSEMYGKIYVQHKIVELRYDQTFHLPHSPTI